MTPALRFLWALRARGVRLWVEGERLQYDAPEGAITAEDRARVPELKADLLRLLTEKCECGPCAEGDEPHGDRCYCPACIRADPELDKYRERADAEDAARKVDAQYEAEERAAIQEEGCTPAEFAALKAAKKEEVP